MSGALTEGSIGHEAQMGAHGGICKKNKKKNGRLPSEGYARCRLPREVDTYTGKQLVVQIFIRTVAADPLQNHKSMANLNADQVDPLNRTVRLPPSHWYRRRSPSQPDPIVGYVPSYPAIHLNGGRYQGRQPYFHLISTNDGDRRCFPTRNPFEAFKSTSRTIQNSYHHAPAIMQLVCDAIRALQCTCTLRR